MSLPLRFRPVGRIRRKLAAMLNQQFPDYAFRAEDLEPQSLGKIKEGYVRWFGIGEKKSFSAKCWISSMDSMTDIVKQGIFVVSDTNNDLYILAKSPKAQAKD